MADVGLVRDLGDGWEIRRGGETYELRGPRFSAWLSETGFWIGIHRIPIDLLRALRDAGHDTTKGGG